MSNTSDEDQDGIPFPSYIGELGGQPYYHHNFKRKFNLELARMYMSEWFNGSGHYLRRGHNPVLAIGEKDTFFFTLSKKGEIVFRHEEGEEAALIMYIFIYRRLLRVLNVNND
jgi:hypothetical protein